MSFRRILIALDDTAIAAHAAEVGAQLAAAVNSEIALVHVVNSPRMVPPDSGISVADEEAALKREGQLLLAAVAQRSGKPALQFLRQGNPADEILATAREWDADLIVIGTHGRSGFPRLVLGSTAESVLHHAPCPVLVIRPHAGA